MPIFVQKKERSFLVFETVEVEKAVRFVVVAAVLNVNRDDDDIRTTRRREKERKSCGDERRFRIKIRK